MANIDMDRTAQIAFLRLSDDEKQKFEAGIKKETEALDRIDGLSDVAPTTKITKIIAYRKDEVIPASDRDELLKNAKGNSNGAFTVPKIVE